MLNRRVITYAAVMSLSVPIAAERLSDQSRPGPPASAAISEQDLREHLTYIASDELEGRATYTEGLGLAAAYIAQHLKEWGVQPGGDNGSYFQRVASVGVRTTRG
jgi:hypothetical protein